MRFFVPGVLLHGLLDLAPVRVSVNGLGLFQQRHEVLLGHLTLRLAFLLLLLAALDQELGEERLALTVLLDALEEIKGSLSYSVPRIILAIYSDTAYSDTIRGLPLAATLRKWLLTGIQ